jgi:hypothetical protein
MKRTYDVNNPQDVQFCVEEMQKLNDALFEMELEFQGDIPAPYPEGYSDVDMVLFYYTNLMRQVIERERETP